MTGQATSANTNAGRILARLGIAFEVRTYEAGRGSQTATDVAALIGLPPSQVFKTLVARGDHHGVCLAVLPADTELDFKALARATGNRTAALVALAEVEPLTGYVRGGVTALATRRPLPVFAHLTLAEHAQIAVSAGVRGAQLILSPADYLRATGATIAAIARPSSAGP